MTGARTAFTRLAALSPAFTAARAAAAARPATARMLLRPAAVACTHCTRWHSTTTPSPVHDATKSIPTMPAVGASPVHEFPSLRYGPAAGLNKNLVPDLKDATPYTTKVPSLPVPSRVQEGKDAAHVTSVAAFDAMWKQSINDPETFFGEHARNMIDWIQPFTKTRHGDFKTGDTAWFVDGTLNMSYNCIDRHALRNPDKVAIICERDDPNDAPVKVTYGELLKRVSQLANCLKEMGLKKGDRVALYMPECPETAIAMLACVRLGLVHSVVFPGFSHEALADRIRDAECKVLITADEAMRGGQRVPLKNVADEALYHTPSVEKVIVFQHTKTNAIKMKAGRDIYWDDAVKPHRPYCAPVPVAAEDPLFMLYTSGSTGQPKGIVHVTAGYLLGIMLGGRYGLDIRESDVVAVAASAGWILGASYVVYGPLALGATTIMFESIPTWPTPDRYWSMIERHRATQFFTAPTAIRALRRLGDEHVLKYDLSSLRLIATAGEPINEAAHEWYFNVVGKGKIPVIDTYWQTETGSPCIHTMPGVRPMKRGSATHEFFGTQVAILDPETGHEITEPNVTGVLCYKHPIPSLCRTIFGDHQRYESVYFKEYPGHFFTGDSAYRDEDGYLFVTGRCDDVINTAGHRLGGTELESTLVAHEVCAEAAVIGAHDEIKGQAPVAFVTLKPTHIPVDQVPVVLRQHIRSAIGAIAAPKYVIVVDELPKTRSGKIMRRILRKIMDGESHNLGDTSTLADPDVVDKVIKATEEAIAAQSKASSKPKK
ncbi:acetyl-coenzyme A synthetase 2 [Allomyces javanicus]|nr:acetyl-coenzyme A synthetase 2 [Allomyces javanicus]